MKTTPKLLKAVVPWPECARLVLAVMLAWVSAHAVLLGQGTATGPFVERHILGCQVTLYADPPRAVTNYSVKERPPFGVPGFISSGGSFDQATGLISFGPFTGDQSRILSYEDMPPCGAAGRFPVWGETVGEGFTAAVVGDAYVDIAPFPPPSLRLLLRLRPLSHQTAVQIEANRNAVCQLQASANLADWANVAVVATPEWITEWLDPEPGLSTSRFYRAWLITPPVGPFGSWDYQGYDSSGQLIVTGLLTFSSPSPPFLGTWEFVPAAPRPTSHYEGQGAFTEVTLTGTTVTVDLTPPGVIDNSFRLAGEMMTDTYSGHWFWDGEGPSESGSFTAQRKR